MSEWRLITNWGSLRSGDPDDRDAAFHAGHVNDVLRLNIPPFFPTIVASDTSGVWLVNELGGIAMPLSTTWDAPHLNCLSAGFYNDLHVYAAGDALFETDTTSPAPLLNWRPIKVQTDGEHPLTPGEIRRVIVVRERRKIVLAADGGVFWANIPVAGGVYSFKKATSLPGMRYSGLAEGSGNSVLAGAWGSDLKAHFGIFVGDWTGPSGDLIFHRATITGSINERQMLRTEIASCAGNRLRLYAVCGGGGALTPKLDKKGKPLKDAFGDVQWDGDDLIFRVLRSNDGGMTWKVAGNTVVGSSDLLFNGNNDIIGHTQFGYNLCVGVSPFHPSLVAIGVGGFAISDDGARTWQVFNEGTSPHLHTDIHGVVFDQTDLAHTRLYICSDGGLASTPDLGKTFFSGGNRQLPNFQFFRFAASSQNSGLIGGSLQDNGDVYTMLYVNPDPWKDLDGGDGILMMFLQSGHLVRHNNTLVATDSTGTDIEYGNKTRIAEWDDAKRAFQDLKLLPNAPLSWGVIPVDATGDGLANQNQGNDNIIEVVDLPDWRNAGGHPMLAVAAEAETVYGLFSDGQGGFAWNQLAIVPHKPSKDAKGNDLPYFATAVASRDGNAIVVGMNNGKIFRLDAPAWVVSEITITGNTKSLVRFSVIAPSRIFAIAGKKVFRHDGTSWKDVTPTIPAPTSSLTAITADRSNPTPKLFLASSSQIWESEDGGGSWSDLKGSLPHSTQITDLRFVIESSGAEFLYLATFGWSAFRRLLNFDEVLKTVTVTGHMDIVDRVAVGHDIWSHPPIANTLNLGPLHPFEEAEYTVDDGDEVRVVLKLRFEWHIDFSVVAKYDATLIAMDEDNYVDDHQSGSFSVPFSTTKQQIIDLASDEFWPDRAHIEIFVANP
jgi:hypothetical protein